MESLKVFCDIVRYRSFSQAARAWGLTQSAASQIVSQLEKRLEVQLINRSVRPLQLTALGQMYYDGCRGLIQQYDELEASVRNAQSELAATVRVAAIYSVGLGDMGQHVERFGVRYPNARVQIDYLHPDRVYERVLDGTADLGLVSFPRKSRELAALPWRDEEMVLTCPPGHPLAGLRRVAVTQLAGEKYVGFDKGLVIRREVDRFLREHDTAVDVALEFDNIENIKKAVEIAAGIALLPEPTVRKEVLAGSLVAVPLEGGRFVRPLGVIYRRNQRLSSSAQCFLDLLRHPEAGNGSEPPRGHAYRNGAGPSPRTIDSTRGQGGPGRGTNKIA
jgi:DNA-binding transcriptional LysR family regulator